MPSSLRSALALLLACGVIATVSTLWLGARHQSRQTELLRLENQALDQELRLLRQQLEAERILAAARLRQLEATPPAPASSEPLTP